MKDKNSYYKIFILMCIAVIGMIALSYIADMMNAHDDIVSGAGVLLLAAVLLSMMMGVYKVINYKPKKQKQNGKS